MNRLRTWLVDALTRDDLFLRVACFSFGILVAGSGVGCIYAVVVFDDQSWKVMAAVWGVAVVLIPSGCLLLVRPFTASAGSMRRLADNYLPDPVVLEEATVLYVVFLLPLALLTVLLRSLGVRGQVA